MQKTRSTTLQVGVAVAFAFSCFGLLLFLWVSFGGPVPLKPQGYRVTIPFQEATQLAVEADVRVSGVSVGKVKEIELSEEGEGFADATVEIDADFAPIPADTRAILRAKTLLGETYVELTPGDPDVGSLPEDGELPAAQVAESVQLDEIFRTFDARTRAAFQTWMQQAAIAVRGRGADLSAAIANLEPFTEETRRLLRVLDTQDRAVRQLIRNTGVVFEALSERRGQLSGLIVNADTVFSTTARRDRDLEAAFLALPTFLRESRGTLARLERFAETTDPLVTQLRPAARELSGTLENVARVSPSLEGFFRGMRKVIANSRQGLPALRRFLDDELPPILGQLEPFLDQLDPILETVTRYRREVAAFLGNAAAATNGRSPSPEIGNRTANYIRVISPINPELIATYPGRLQMNRTNPYTQPGGYAFLESNLESFETRQCTGGLNASIDPADSGLFPGDLFQLIRDFAFDGGLSTTGVPRPGCDEQAPQQSIGKATSELSDYLHVFERQP